MSWSSVGALYIFVSVSIHCSPWLYVPHHSATTALCVTPVMLHTESRYSTHDANGESYGEFSKVWPIALLSL